MIQLYTTPYCGYCVAAKRLLARRGYAYEETDVSQDYARRQQVSKLAGGYRMVPMVFIDGAFIGGYDELAAMDRSGELAAAIGGRLRVTSTAG